MAAKQLPFRSSFRAIHQCKIYSEQFAINNTIMSAITIAAQGSPDLVSLVALIKAKLFQVAAAGACTCAVDSTLSAVHILAGGFMFYSTNCPTVKSRQ